MLAGEYRKISTERKYRQMLHCVLGNGEFVVSTVGKFETTKIESQKKRHDDMMSIHRDE